MSYYLENDQKKKFEIKENDKLARKLAMLIEGETAIGAKAASKKYGYSLIRYYQLSQAYKKYGAEALIDKKRGSNKQPVRTEEVTKEIIRQRYLDPFQKAEVISQKLKQKGMDISIRSVQRTITEYGLQKKRMFSTKHKKKVKKLLK